MRAQVSRVARLALVLLLAALGGCASRIPAAPFEIRVVDVASGRGIPAVELRTTDARSFYTDSAGVVALDQADLLGTEVFFAVRSFGYRYEPEVLGFPGVTLRVEPGRSARLDMVRQNIAERLYRLTGSGIYRSAVHPESEAVSGEVSPPVAGLDSALATGYGGELFWVFGDARLLGRPLGSFRAHAARSRLPGRGGLDPRVGVALRFLRDGSELRPMVRDPHPIIWLTALRATRDAAGERLFATYQKIGAGLEIIERGVAELDAASEVFRIVAQHPRDALARPEGPVFRHVEGGRSYFYYDMLLRSPDDAASQLDLASYEAYTPLRPGRAPDAADALERDASGRLVWGWKREAAAVSPAQWEAWLRSGAVSARELPYRLVDVETGLAVTPHHGSIQWNAHRRRWVMLRSQLGGASFLGELYYFEAETPLGPWAYGRKVVSHAMPALAADGSPRPERDTYSFYNPVQHPELARSGGREIFFEGTLSAAFTSPLASPIPRYDYNQMMYRLDLDDPRLALPVAIYRVPGAAPSYGTLQTLPAGASDAELAFFAPDRASADTIELREVSAPGGPSRLVAGGSRGRVLFHCAPQADALASLAFFERRAAGGARSYESGTPGSADAVLCYVWPRPVDFPEDLRRPPARASAP